MVKMFNKKLFRAKIGSGPESQSGFYVAVVVDREIILLVGDLTKQSLSTATESTPQRDISIDCTANNDARLCFSVDNKRVLQIKRLKWKFRGNEKIEVDEVPIQVSWDVYNWLFEDINNSHAVFGLSGIEWMKRRRSLMKTTRSSSSSSISMSSASSGGGFSSIMEWASTEENELSAPIGFSLLVYARGKWK
uniref:DUF868 domain-containing protein n=1 Tax=Manihot esculenta TaxID=3983 RepID=A0A2C9W883_MANES